MLHSYSIRYLPITLHFASAEIKPPRDPASLPALHYLRGLAAVKTHIYQTAYL